MTGDNPERRRKKVVVSADTEGEGHLRALVELFSRVVPEALRMLADGMDEDGWPHKWPLLKAEIRPAEPDGRSIFVTLGISPRPIDLPDEVFAVPAKLIGEDWELPDDPDDETRH